jgi:hypothetical protein
MVQLSCLKFGRYQGNLRREVLFEDAHLYYEVSREVIKISAFTPSPPANHMKKVTFQVLTAASMKMTVF